MNSRNYEENGERVGRPTTRVLAYGEFDKLRGNLGKNDFMEHELPALLNIAEKPLQSCRQPRG